MKTIKNVLWLVAVVAVSFILGASAANALDVPQYAGIFGGTAAAISFIPKGNFAGSLMTNAPDVSALTTSFVRWGGQILGKQVNSLMLGDGVTTFTKVNQPIAMPKLSASGNPRPYTAADSTTNGAAFTDRTLTAFQSKWDFDVDAEQYRNTYLAYVGAQAAAGQTAVPFYEFIINQVGTELMGQLNDNTLFFGARNAAGTTAATIADGWQTIIKADIAASRKAVTTIGAITSANAVTQVELFLAGQPAWWREKPVVIKCSYADFDNYKKHYRTLNAFGFQPRSNGQYYVDGWANAILQPVSGLGAVSGLFATVNGALCFGTDSDRIQVAASTRRNIIEVRLMMPIGMQIADLECVAIDDILAVH